MQRTLIIFTLCVLFLASMFHLGLPTNSHTRGYTGVCLELQGLEAGLVG